MGKNVNFETGALCSYCRHAFNSGATMYIFDFYNITEYDINTYQVISCRKSPVDNHLIKSIYTVNNSLYLQIIQENKAIIGEITLAGNWYLWNIRYATPLFPHYSISIAYNNDRLCICNTYIIQNNKPISTINVHASCFCGSAHSNTYLTTHTTDFTFDTNPIITKLDNYSELLCIALNSMQPFYCQILIISPFTHKGHCKRTIKAITPNDCPPSGENVKLNLTVSNLEWSNDGSFIIILYQTNCIALLSREGHWIKELNPLNTTTVRAVPKVFTKLPKAVINGIKLFRSEDSFLVVDSSKLIVLKSQLLADDCKDPEDPTEVGRLLGFVLANKKSMFNAQILSHLLKGLELIIPESECQKTFRTAAMEFRNNCSEDSLMMSMETQQNINSVDEWHALSNELSR